MRTLFMALAAAAASMPAHADRILLDMNFEGNSYVGEGLQLSQSIGGHIGWQAHPLSSLALGNFWMRHYDKGRSAITISGLDPGGTARIGMDVMLIDWLNNANQPLHADSYVSMFVNGSEIARLSGGASDLHTIHRATGKNYVGGAAFDRLVDLSTDPLEVPLLGATSLTLALQGYGTSFHHGASYAVDNVRISLVEQPAAVAAPGAALLVAVGGVFVAWRRLRRRPAYQRVTASR